MFHSSGQGFRVSLSERACIRNLSSFQHSPPHNPKNNTSPPLAPRPRTLPLSKQLLLLLFRPTPVHVTGNQGNRHPNVCYCTPIISQRVERGYSNSQRERVTKILCIEIINLGLKLLGKLRSAILDEGYHPFITTEIDDSGLPDVSEAFLPAQNVPKGKVEERKGNERGQKCWRRRESKKEQH